MARKQSEVISEEQELLRAEITIITDKGDEATEDELSRADLLMDEFKDKEALRQKALAREAAAEEVMRASLNPGNRESGAANGRRGPEVMRKVEPFETTEDLKRSLWGHGPFNETDTIARATAAIERAPRYLDDNAREHLTNLIELDNRHAPLIARHMLLTGSEQYHDEFRQYIASRGTYVGEALRAAMSLTDANGGRVAVLCG